MKRQQLQIGKPLEVDVKWYDLVPEPPRIVIYQGEVIGWRNTQVIIRIKEYAVCRFWKGSGVEVGNPDHQRRGFSLDVSQLDDTRPEPGPQGIPITIDTDQ